MRSFRILGTLSCLVMCARSDSVSYRVTVGAGACHELRVSTWTPPEEMTSRLQTIQSGNSVYEIRTPREGELYIGLSCPTPRGKSWPVPEKYVANLKSGRVERLDNSVWESALGLQRTSKFLFPLIFQDRGIEYGGHILEKSGPKWAGPYDRPDIYPLISPMHTRLVLNSWDGIVRYVPLEGPLLARDKVKGKFWIDLYDVASARRMIQIQGSFNGSPPSDIQGAAAWFTEQYYVLPLAPKGMRRLLVCDVDAADRMSGSGLKQRNN
jgi:hypothetical protein